MASIQVDGKRILLNPFMCSMVGNVVEALAKSLKSPRGSRVDFFLRGDDLQMQVDQKEVPLNLGHAKQIVGNVLRGILNSVHGAENASEIQITWEEETL